MFDRDGKALAQAARDYLVSVEDREFDPREVWSYAHRWTHEAWAAIARQAERPHPTHAEITKAVGHLDKACHETTRGLTEAER